MYLAAVGTLLTLMVAQPATAPDWSEEYVKIVLALGEHDRDYVDAPYGPPEWRAQIQQDKPDLPSIDARAAELLKRLAAILLLRARVAMLSGRKFTFDEESRALYDAKECRARTLQHIALPAGESFTVEYVKGKSLPSEMK